MILGRSSGGAAASSKLPFEGISGGDKFGVVGAGVRLQFVDELVDCKVRNIVFLEKIS